MKELLSAPDDAGFPLDLHHSMVFDSRRVQLFQKALAAVVKPGDTVVDVGSGTGILSFLAWRAGAGRVIGLEKSEIIETARKAKEKHYPDAPIEFLRIDVLREALPDVKADVIVCELIGNLGLEEGIVPVLARLRSRILADDGVMIPSRMRLIGCPVTVHELYDDLARWGETAWGIELSPFRDLAFNRVYHLEREVVDLLAEPRELAALDLFEVEATPSRLAADFEIATLGKLHGVATWSESDLAPGIVLDTGPKEEKLHWGHVFFPSGPARTVKAGSPLTFELKLEDNEFELDWSWSMRIGDDRIAYSARGQA